MLFLLWVLGGVKMNMREKMARALEGDDPDRLISDVIPYNPSRAFPAWRQQLPKIDAVLDAIMIDAIKAGK